VFLRVGLVAAIIGLGLGAGAGPAQAASRVVRAPAPVDPFPVGSAQMTAVVALAQRYWATNPCGGVVQLRWVSMPPASNGLATWFNPVDPYAQPELNTDCVISLNRDAYLPWDRFCTVVVHEFGHLSGHPHSADGLDVMSPFLRAPIPECVALPEPPEEPSRSRRA
jgi:hypothetical protein